MASIPVEFQSIYDLYTRGPSLVNEAIAGLDAGAINTRIGDSWSSRDILIHLADAETFRAARIRLVLTEDQPLIVGWNEELAQRRLQYLWRSPELALATFEQLVYSTAEILMHIDRAAWQRSGVHEERGPMTVADFVEAGVEHVAEHAARIRELRETIGR
jgi:hypothetical protein